MKRKQKRRVRILDILMVVILLTGVGVLAYPFVQDALNDYLAQELITHYQKQANEKNEKEMAKSKVEMEKKNKEIAEEGGLPGMDVFTDAVSEEATADLPDNAMYEEHTIAVLSIPKISVNVPIFDETTEIFLQKGVSLLEGSSYPTGGDSTHAVISGHRGLPEAKLFTDLPELVIGDQFFIQINGETLAYEVDKIQTIEPTNIEPLRVQAGKDLVTLMTCTPYMVNTHRLLVTGHRIPYTEKAAAKQIAKVTNTKRDKLIAWIAGTVAAALIVLAALLHFFKMAAIGRKRFAVKFYLVDSEDEPLIGETFALKTKNGKRAVTRDKAPIILMSDDEGLVTFPDLKGGKYRLVGSLASLKLKVKNRKATQFNLKLLKKGPELESKEKIYYLKMTSSIGGHKNENQK